MDLDLIVIGTGAGGGQAASVCRDAGWSVAIIDDQPFGGTCVLRGCDPKKMLRRAAEVVNSAQAMADAGVSGAPTIDWPALMKFKRTFTDGVPESNEKWYADAGIRALHGTATFVDEGTIAVGDERLSARHFVIASGAKPFALGIKGEEHVATSTEFLDLDELPARILFIGGGFISMEFAHIAARAGAEVVVLEMAGRPLPAFEPELVDALVERTRSEGVDVRMNAAVESVESRDGKYIVTAQVGAAPEIFETDLVVHGAGRAPALDELDLEAAGVQRVRGGVEVNEYLQSVSNPRVYAAGDATASGGPPLTPVGGAEGRAAADNLLNGNRTKLDYNAIPFVVFTIPPLARVGMLESEARDAGIDVEVTSSEMSGWYYVRRVREPAALAKVVVEKASGRILGAQILGPEADEMINLFALTMRAGLKAPDLKDLIATYLSAASNVQYLF